MIHVTTNPADSELTVQVAPGGEALINFQAIAFDDDDTLPRRRVQCTVDWLDGADPVILGALEPATPVSPFTATIQRLLPIGSHVARITATNSRSPSAEKAQKLVYVDVTTETLVPRQPPIITGPIIPSDSNYPNPDQWNFNKDDDTCLLASNVKMLLVTRRGERVMDPTYGINFDKALFSLDANTAKMLIQHEISAALASREPRVKLVALKIAKTGTSLEITADLESQLTGKRFSVAAQLSA